MNLYASASTDLLDWHGVSIFLGRGKVRRITLTEILRHLAPINEGRDDKDRITYDSLWVHFQRHYDLAGIVAYRRTRMAKEFKKSSSPCGMTGVGRLANSPGKARLKYEEIGPSVTLGLHLSHRVIGVKVQVTNACAPRVTASRLYACRRYKRDLRPPRL